MRTALLLFTLTGCSDYGLFGWGKDEPQPGGEPGHDDPVAGDEEPDEDDDSGEPPPDETCEDAVAPGPYTVDVDDACLAEPTVGSFEPVVEWQWSENPIHAGYDQVMATPVVGHVNDDNGDGSAEVIFGQRVFAADGAELWAGSGGRGGTYVQPAAADWDGDGQQEVIAGNTIYDTDGSTLLTVPHADGYPAVVDFDGDLAPDLVLVTGGTVVLTANDGTELWQSTVPGGGGGPPTVADFDADGEPEIGMAGGHLYTVLDTDGATLWSSPTHDTSSGITGSSVFDFEDDGRAEVVYADQTDLWVFDGETGTVRLREDRHASGTLLENPVIADVDGDGSSEIVLASNTLYTPGWNGITVIGDATHSWAPSREVWNQPAYSISNVGDDMSIPASPTPNWERWNTF